MYRLFEIKRILSLGHWNSFSEDTEITYSAYKEYKTKSILALVCTNDYLLFRFVDDRGKPIFHQLQWFHNPTKQIRAISFEKCGLWCLLAVRDGTLYIVPMIWNMGHSPKGQSNWRTDDVTEIRLSGQRANPTSLIWWSSFDGQQIAIVGNELGEISFINLRNRREVGGTYVTVGIKKIDLVQDENSGTTCLLITGTNAQQWHLLLEDKQTGYLWLSEPDNEQWLEGIERKMWQLQGDRSLFIEDKKFETHPRRLSRYEGGAVLFPQVIKGQTYVAAYTKASGLLQLLSIKLESLSNISYYIPLECQQFIMTDRSFFLVKNDEGSYSLEIAASQSTESVKKPKESPDPLLEKFQLDSEVINVHQLAATKSLVRERAKENDGIVLPPEIYLDGCVIVQKNKVLLCRMLKSPRDLFLSLTSLPSDLPAAERLGVLLGLDIHKLYEAGAELQLAEGHFAQAVRLYQLSKCPQLKRVAHFVSYGYLSELIAYIQVLFTTKGMEIAMPDKAHFANIALHCFVQQVMDRSHERPAVLQAFKDFLRDNQYYDDEVAIRLLEEQGLYDLLYYCTRLRGQQRLMLEHLLACENLRDAVDRETQEALVGNGYKNILLKTQNSKYLHCVTCPGLLQHLAIKPQLLRCHLQHVAQLLPTLSISYLIRVAQLYDPCHPAACLAVRHVVISHSQRYFSMSSLSSISSDSLEFSHGDDDNVSEEDFVKFFIFVLLVLNHKRSPIPRPFELNLMQIDSGTTMNTPRGEKPTPAQIFHTPLACGNAHSALVRQGVIYSWGKGQYGRLGHGEPYQESSMPMIVDLTDVLIYSVACGAHHTLALTDHGVFAWGSSKYGQLGLGELQRTCRPLLIESLVDENIISIICGQYHSLAVTVDGRIFSWGWGVHGQLGHGNPEDCRAPVQITYFKDTQIAMASAGHGHSVVLTRIGEVFTFGCGMFGQLGQGTVLKQTTPRLVVLPEPVILLASGYFHVLALTQTQRLFVWGSHPQSLRLQAQSSRRARAQQQQLSSASNPSSSQESGQASKSSPPSTGQSSNFLNYGTSPHLSSMISQPLSMPPIQSHLVPNLVNTSNIDGKIVNMVAGSNHSVILTMDGEVYTWGRNSEGQLGHGARKEQKQPTMILTLNDRHIVEVACGSDFTLVVDTSARLWGWGQNDGGQLGQKPTVTAEGRPRTSSLANVAQGQGAAGASGGRVITIRTNRRMITITQGCRQGEMRPIEILSLPPISTPGTTGGSKNAPISQEFDLTSFENDFSLQKMRYKQKRRESPIIPSLGPREDHVYSPEALHSALKVFHRYYDPTSILNHSLSFGDLQCAAKLCVLEGLYAQALQYQLQAFEANIPSRTDKAIDTITIALEILNFYVKYVDKNNSEANRQFLEHAGAFWVKHNLQIDPFETFLSYHLNILGYPLGLFLFCDGSSKKGISEELLCRLSTNFCLDVAASVLKCVDSGRQHPELLDHLVSASGSTNLLRQLHTSPSDSLAGWESALPAQALWQEVLHNFQKGALSRSSLHLSSSSVELLTKALVTERGVSGGNGATIQNGSLCDDIVAFTCGHHYTLNTFRSSVLPGFQEAMQRLPCPLPQTERLLMKGYQSEGLMPTACPPCVLTEIKSEL